MSVAKQAIFFMNDSCYEKALAGWQGVAGLRKQRVAHGRARYAVPRGCQRMTRQPLGTCRLPIPNRSTGDMG